MHHKKWFVAFVACALVLTLLAGCNQAQRPNDDNDIVPSPTRANDGNRDLPFGNDTGDNRNNLNNDRFGTRTNDGVGNNNNAGNNAGNNMGNNRMGNNNGLNGNNGVGNNNINGNNGIGNNVNNNNNDNMRLADDIADRVADMKQVNDATVLLNNRNAFVAVDMSGDKEGRLTNDLKDQITNKVRDTDANINNVYVSADADFFDRVGQYADDVRDGEPIQGLVDEITETIRRVFPTTNDSR